MLDQAGDEDAESLDVTPGARYDADGDDRALRSDSWFAELAADAAALAGERDPKLQAALEARRATSSSRATTRSSSAASSRPPSTSREHLRDALGAQSRGRRRDRSPRAGGARGAGRRSSAAHERRVLVATDCLSEGINLQEHFDAVVHYDLSWNPTRHEQREGRVDRYGQPSRPSA